MIVSIDVITLIGIYIFAILFGCLIGIIIGVEKRRRDVIAAIKNRYNKKNI